MRPSAHRRYLTLFVGHPKVALPVEYHPLAERELEEAIAYYSQRAPGLDVAFHAEVRRAERLVTRYPEAVTPLEGEVRRVLLERFPYGLIYTVEPERIYVLAVGHLRRRPHYWTDRR